MAICIRIHGYAHEQIHTVIGCRAAEDLRIRNRGLQHFRICVFQRGQAYELYTADSKVIFITQAHSLCQLKDILSVLVTGRMVLFLVDKDGHTKHLLCRIWQARLFFASDCKFHVAELCRDIPHIQDISTEGLCVTRIHLIHGNLDLVTAIGVGGRVFAYIFFDGCRIHQLCVKIHGVIIFRVFPVLFDGAVLRDRIVIGSSHKEIICHISGISDAVHDAPAIGLGLISVLGIEAEVRKGYLQITGGCFCCHIQGIGPVCVAGAGQNEG